MWLGYDVTKKKRAKGKGKRNPSGASGATRHTPEAPSASRHRFWPTLLAVLAALGAIGAPVYLWLSERQDRITAASEVARLERKVATEEKKSEELSRQLEQSLADDPVWKQHGGRFDFYRAYEPGELPASLSIGACAVQPCLTVLFDEIRDGAIRIEYKGAVFFGLRDDPFLTLRSELPFTKGCTGRLVSRGIDLKIVVENDAMNSPRFGVSVARTSDQTGPSFTPSNCGAKFFGPIHAPK